MTTLENLYYGNIAPYKLTTIIGFTDKKGIPCLIFPVFVWWE